MKMRVVVWTVQLLFLHAAVAAFQTRPPLPVLTKDGVVVVNKKHRAGKRVPAVTKLTPSSSSSLLTRLASVAVPFQNDTVALASSSSSPTIWERIATAGIANATVLDRMRRSVLVLGACVFTVQLRTLQWPHQQLLTIIQASSVTGLIACLLLPSPAAAAAAFCGSFAGMSGHVGTVAEAVPLGAACAAMYYIWDAYKIGLGKGGRLGTIALCANLVYYYCFTNHAGILAPLRDALVPTLRSVVGQHPWTIAAMLVSGSALYVSRRDTTTPVVEQGTKPKNTNLVHTVVKCVSKVALLGAVAARLCYSSSNVGAVDVARTATAVFGASMAVQKSPGVVLPTSLVGLAGSLAGSLAAPIYMGAFLGMTALKNFTVINFLQSSLFAAMLFHLGIFDGFGGKLGFLSFLSVLFGI
jgi:hypothetical protein